MGAALLTPGAAGAAGSRNQDAYRDLGSTTRLDWMANIADDTSLAAMSLPGTHDTLAIHGGAITQTQEDFGDNGKTLKAQLEHGIRAIDVRVRIGGARISPSTTEWSSRRPISVTFWTRRRPSSRSTRARRW
ncbi:hypothetical protein AB0B79_24350 [Streptomyces sp. NPDC039022]|uniref:hypothetical protein n=1 Tax=unclassified Streptomyces TaxID=2593676 RepID=UPI0033C49C5A